MAQVADIGLPPHKTAETYAQSKAKVDELFLQWVALDDTKKWIMEMIGHAKSGLPIYDCAVPTTVSASQGMSPRHVATPLSPRSPVKLPSSPRAGGTSPPNSPLLKIRSVNKGDRNRTSSPTPQMMKDREEKKLDIPRFWFPKTKVDDDRLKEERATIASIFNGYVNGVDRNEFTRLNNEVCEYPSFFKNILFDRLDPGKTGKVTQSAFMKFWDSYCSGRDDVERFFNLIRNEKRKYLISEDFKPFIKELLQYHQGLEFLQATPEFQEKYSETVVVRIFYTVNTSGNSQISLNELRNSNLVETFKIVDEEADINKVYNYFSYEHFYVLYCKFWELDTDHDCLLDKEDLLRYANYSLTYRIVDRIFAEAPRKITSEVEGKMGYEDFIWFCLSEEDKTSPTAIAYWFKCVDTDSDGIISAYEMEYFYQEQLHRMECLSQEIVPFDDICCQLLDMVKPEGKHIIQMKDLRTSKLAGNFFNILFNLNKFIAFEQRDPFIIRQEQATPEMTDWDRFAHAEYCRLSMEDEGIDEDGGEVDGWEQDTVGGVRGTVESPF